VKKIAICLAFLFCTLFCTACSTEEIKENAASLVTQVSSLIEEDKDVQETETETVQSEPAVETDAEYSAAEETFDTEVTITEDGVYTSKEDVAYYIYLYDHLPDNFITKKEAQALGWSGGSLEPYAPGKCIGGSYFGNYEGILPEEEGRSYTECDIDTLGASSRGAKRIVFSNDGLIYYTEDHYQSFELLYGEE
jgi:guanyl-specific ribonuclease Sa